MHGFKVSGRPSELQDSGFDVYGIEEMERDKFVCVQCKRYAEALTASSVAEELGKVAINKTIEGSTITRHLFITSGTVSEKLQKNLRESGRSGLQASAETRGYIWNIATAHQLQEFDMLALESFKTHDFATLGYAANFLAVRRSFDELTEKALELAKNIVRSPDEDWFNWIGHRLLNYLLECGQSEMVQNVVELQLERALDSYARIIGSPAFVVG